MKVKVSFCTLIELINRVFQALAKFYHGNGQSIYKLATYNGWKLVQLQTHWSMKVHLCHQGNQSCHHKLLNC